MSLPLFFPHPQTHIPPVSACHGAGDDPISPTCYPSRFFQWWNTVFPHPATELTNGALRRTNSGYFGYCNSHHLPDQMDLVIIELDTEDEPCVSFSFSSVSFIPAVSFLASVRYWSVATALRPLYFMHSSSSLKQRTVPHQARVGAHEAIPSCLFAHSSSAMASICFTLFTSSMSFSFRYDHCHLPRSPSSRVSSLVPFVPYPSQSFSSSRFPETAPRLEARA